jgi:hypothetical protein
MQLDAAYRKKYRYIMRDSIGGQWYGKNDIWTLLWPDGIVKVVYPGGPGEVLEDGSLSMKFPWWLGPRAD